MTTTLERAISRKIFSEESKTAILDDVWKYYHECINDQLDEIESKWDTVDDAVWSTMVQSHRYGKK